MFKSSFINYLLLPFSVLYGLGVAIRNKLFDARIIKSYEFNLPVISVGNLKVGGTGKTPVAEYLTDLLLDESRVAVLSRGYKRKSKGFVLATNSSTPFEIGDEPCQIKSRYPGAIVAVCESRVKGVRKILEAHPDTDVILLDDAYQHRYIVPGLSILLVDYNHPATRDFLLPAGRLREPFSSKKRANIILVTKCPENLRPIERRLMVKELEIPPYQNLFFTSLKYGELSSVFPGYSAPSLEDLKELKPEIILLTGIVNPEPLKKFALGFSSAITAITFPDHHEYRVKDVKMITDTFQSINSGKKIILTTWKDAVRLKEITDFPGEIKKSFFFIPIKTTFLNEDQVQFNKQIIRYVRDNNRNSILHKGKNKV